MKSLMYMFVALALLAISFFAGIEYGEIPSKARRDNGVSETYVVIFAPYRTVQDFSKHQKLPSNVIASLVEQSNLAEAYHLAEITKDGQITALMSIRGDPLVSGAIPPVLILESYRFK